MIGNLTVLQKYLIMIACGAILAACGGGGGGSTNVGAALVGAGASGGGGSSGSNNTPAPQITSFTVTPSSAQVGDTVTISWASSNATGCTAYNDWGGAKDTSGTETKVVSEEKQYRFRLICNGNGSDDKSVYVDVDDPYTEGSCRNPHNKEFSRKYMGDFDIPLPEATLPDHFMKNIGLKDHGPEWIYGNYVRMNADWTLFDCTEEQYAKLMYRLALMEIFQTGAKTVTIYNFGYWKNANAVAWQLDWNSLHITKPILEYIIETAHDIGLEVHFVWQFLPLDMNQNWLFPFNGTVSVDMARITKMMDAHEDTIVEWADWLQQRGVDSIAADWSSLWVCFCGEDFNLSWDDPIKKEIGNYYMERLSGIIDEIRAVFSGDITVGDNIIWNDYRVTQKADYVSIGVGNIITEAENETDFDVNLITTRTQDYIERLYMNWYHLDGQPPGDFATNDPVPFVFGLFAQSTAFFAHRGWIEDGFCTAGTVNGKYNDTCMQLDVPIDFSRQAIYYEGILRGIYYQTYFDFAGVIAPTSYWITPSLQHHPKEKSVGTVVEGFPEISQSIRGKPAENILKYWFTEQWDNYDPIFSD